MILINVDFDGVLVPNTYEDNLNQKIKDENLSYDDCSPVWNWYEKHVVKPLELNTDLLVHLSELKDNGYAIRLWTNRAYTLKKQTLENIGDWKSLFDSFHFHSGCKGKTNVEGIVIDNSKQYLNCGEVGIHYNLKGGK